MRYLLCCLLATVACGSNDSAPVDVDMCHNITDETSVAVPYQFDVGTEVDTYTMDNGCIYTTITHFVYDSDTSGTGAGGSAPDPLHCDADGCGGPLDKRIMFSDPVMDNMMMNKGH